RLLVPKNPAANAGVDKCTGGVEELDVTLLIAGVLGHIYLACVVPGNPKGTRKIRFDKRGRSPEAVAGCGGRRELNRRAHHLIADLIHCKQISDKLLSDTLPGLRCRDRCSQLYRSGEARGAERQ